MPFAAKPAAVSRHAACRCAPSSKCGPRRSRHRPGRRHPARQHHPLRGVHRQRVQVCSEPAVDRYKYIYQYLHYYDEQQKKGNSKSDDMGMENVNLKVFQIAIVKKYFVNIHMSRPDG